MEARDKRLIMKLAVALADLTHRDAPLRDCITELGFSGRTWRA
jgi:hypothetical protein